MMDQVFEGTSTIISVLVFSNKREFQSSIELEADEHVPWIEDGIPVLPSLKKPLHLCQSTYTQRWSFLFPPLFNKFF